MNATGQRIAETFERHVETHGYERTTLDEVARELKISKKTIYVHFTGKRDIYAHVVARQAQLMKTQLAASVAALPTYAARSESVMRSILESGRATSRRPARTSGSPNTRSRQMRFARRMETCFANWCRAGWIPANSGPVTPRWSRR